ncbi:hypothetical protein FKN04_24655 [Bacillus glycinifermentans]|uniref:hypothetical protein n=1 Tax=Bacillus glycinifermentans TaxID=1664069 RepID=UPI0015839498|nr:hypothetical protein [Bacillus glycinifermentans]NUJ19715.1 hypothetical protein [Bacillus glycinifermentans]
MDKTLLHEMITELYHRTKAGELDRIERIKEINALVEAYHDSVGKSPDSAALERMANLIIYEELSDTNKNKMKDLEYPIMSERMEKTRRSGETSEKMAEEYDKFGKYQGKPVRRRLSTYEGIQVDRRAKARNKERRKKYSDFVKGKTPGQFTVNITTGEKTIH